MPRRQESLKPQEISVDGVLIGVTYIGRGAYVRAFLGTDGMVYLLTQGRDISKRVMMEAKARSHSHHLPDIREHQTNEPDSTLFSMPYYRELPEDKTPWPYLVALRNGQLRVEKDKTIPYAIRRACRAILKAAHGRRYRVDMGFKNFSIRHDGVLVIRDPIVVKSRRTQ